MDPFMFCAWKGRWLLTILLGSAAFILFRQAEEPLDYVFGTMFSVLALIYLWVSIQVFRGKFEKPPIVKVWDDMPW